MAPCWVVASGMYVSDVSATLSAREAAAASRDELVTAR
jgi:hypothetical protein